MFKCKSISVYAQKQYFGIHQIYLIFFFFCIQHSVRKNICLIMKHSTDRYFAQIKTVTDNVIYSSFYTGLLQYRFDNTFLEFYRCQFHFYIYLIFTMISRICEQKGVDNIDMYRLQNFMNKLRVIYIYSYTGSCVKLCLVTS